MSDSEPFANLFKRYRLRSEFETLSEFGDALADHNLIYENSIFSHWQKGTRTPKERKLIYTMIRIFSERKGITSEDEANSIMASTGLGYLTREEIEHLQLPLKRSKPFQAPRKLEVFIGRKEHFFNSVDLLKNGSIVTITGQAGVGKTSLAISLAHELKDFFPDGVIWCSCSTSSPLTILHQIAQSFGEILPLNASEKEASMLCRSFIADKKALFILDGAIESTPLDLLLPNSSQSGVLITSVFNSIHFAKYGVLIKLEPFNKTESDDLFKTLIPESILKKNRKYLQKISQDIGYLPLALNIVSKQISHGLHLENLNTIVEDSTSSLSASLEVSYSHLPKSAQLILQICSVLEGGSISFEAFRNISRISIDMCKRNVVILKQYSLLEEIEPDRFSIHPIIKSFLRTKKMTIHQHKHVANYYREFIKKYQRESDYFTQMAPEVENIVGVIRTCIQKKLEMEACELWKLFGSYYWHVGAWRDFKDISNSIYSIAERNNNYELLLSICLEEVSRLYYYDGNIQSAISRAEEGLDLAAKIENGYWQALAHQRFGKLCFMKSSIDIGLKHLCISQKAFQKMNNPEYLSHNARYMSEAYILCKDFKKAEELLNQSLVEIRKVSNEVRKTIYESVIFSHLGVLSYIQNDFKNARKYFTAGLKSDQKYPLVRGTYTWLNKLGLALSYMKLGFIEESKQLLLQSQKQRKQLGIEKSFSTINVYSSVLAKELNDANAFLS